MEAQDRQRVVVFIDEANVYNDARRCFHPQATSSTEGRVWPMRFARALVDLAAVAESLAGDLHARVSGSDG